MRRETAVALLLSVSVDTAGCGGGAQFAPAGAPQQKGIEAREGGDCSPSGGVTRGRRSSDAILRSTPRVRGPRTFDLAVTDGNDVVAILNARYKYEGSISDGIKAPQGESYDSKGNLYVANAGSQDVQEYARGATEPSYTYYMSARVPGGVPVDVATDARSNVYAVVAAGVNCRSYIQVIEYPQHSNWPVASCRIGWAWPSGIAVDSAADVFVSWNGFQRDRRGVIEEFTGGLKNCNGKELTQYATPFYTGELRIARDGTILAADISPKYSAPTIDVIPLPYTRISRQIGTFDYPSGVALGKDESRLFVADNGAGTVSVLSYPGGKLLQTLDTKNGGVSAAWGVAASK